MIFASDASEVLDFLRAVFRDGPESTLLKQPF